MTAQRMGAYIGSQKGSWRIGSQRVMPATLKESLVNISISKGEYFMTGSISLNNEEITLPYSFSSSVGEEYTIGVVAGHATYEVVIKKDGETVASALKQLTYSFSATSDTNIVIYISE